MRTAASPSQGFTLIEVLVALGILAVALAAGSRAGSALIHNAQRQSQALLAQLCAENELTRIRLNAQFPDLGEAQSTCPQAGYEFTVQTSVLPTPNPNFRRVDARVLADGQPRAQLTTLIGRM